jgi:hypothetical protein
MPIEVKAFDDIDTVAADADGALDRVAQQHLHDRLEWYRLAEAYRPSRGRARIWRANDGDGGRAWLFLSVDRNGGAEALALWYTLAFRPVFAGEGDRVALIAAIARGLRQDGVGSVSLAPVPDGDDTLSVLDNGFRAAGWWTRARAENVNWVADTKDVTFASYWRGRPGQLRSTAARKSKTVDLDITIHRGFDGDAWAAYEQVYAASWKPTEGSPAFLRAFGRVEGAAGTLRLGLARHEGEPIAAQLWTVENGVATIHKLAHVEAARDMSPGTLLSAAMFGAAIDADHVKLIDFGTGDDGYKADWMDRAEPLHRFTAFDLQRPRGILALLRAAVRVLVARLRGG